MRCIYEQFPLPTSPAVLSLLGEVSEAPRPSLRRAGLGGDVVRTCEPSRERGHANLELALEGNRTFKDVKEVLMLLA